MSGRQTVRDADTGLQTCVHVGDLKELAERLRASDDSCMYFGCWDGPECDGCQAYESPYDCSGAMAHDAADRIDAAITRGVFSAGKRDGEVPDATDVLKVSGCPEARFTLRHDALEVFEWVEEHGGLDALRSELPVLAYRASLVGSVYDALDIDPDEPGAAMLLASEVKRLRDDHDALLWMDEHGGLGQVKMDYAMGEGFTDLVDRVAAKLCVDVEGLDAQDSEPIVMDAIDRRLMPDGMEWPRFEDDEPVRPGSKLLDGDGDWFEAVSFVFTCDWWSARGYQTEGFGDLNNETRRKLEGMAYGTCVKRPTPKVLDADGVEIRVGDTVWANAGKAGDGCGWTVVALNHGIAHSVAAERVDGRHGGARDLKPEWLTHRAPVLAADGKPLREGETVWGTGREQHEYIVLGQPGLGGGAGRFKVTCHDVTDDVDCYCDPSQLTHERPDSWERLEEDANAAACIYFGASSKYCESCEHNSWECAYDKARDLVRRARALAERGQ